LNGRHPGILREAARHDEPRPFDDALDGNVVGRSLDDVVWFDLPPVFRPSHRWGRVLRIALRRTRIAPLHNGIDVTLVQSPLVQEMPEVRIGKPWRRRPPRNP